MWFVFSLFTALHNLPETAGGMEAFGLFICEQAANPISGSNFPPPETLSSQRFQGVPDITVKSQFWVEYIRVDEPNHAFHARYWWAMNYPDYRTQDLISETNASSNCAQ